ncbi:hypothetical protein BKA65DRAFT_195900 [Rhexocercosporidium sp. MPI-PUGE-AT-0058]|nr:hypothetical protein BKA65DRAFT_195900 [Rhexocercosporidium sp. MPI-PUGE-AT-0058]
MQQYIAQFGMLLNSANGRHTDTNIRKEGGPYIDTFGLDNTIKSKPVLGVDDLLLLLNHHWARDTSTSPTERHQVHFPLILLLLFGAECQPAELVDARKKRNDDAHEDDGVMSEVGEDIRYFDAIYYEDVRLQVVRGPDSEGHDGSPQRNKRCPKTRLD